MKANMQTTQEITTALKAQYDAIAVRLAAIDKEQAATLAQYKEQRARLAAGAAPLATALRALGVQVAAITAMQDSEFVRQIFEEWKYRHELVNRMVYRYVWYMTVVAVLPSAAGIPKVLGAPIDLGIEVFRKPGLPRFCYLAFLLLLLVAISSHGATGYMHFMGVEAKLNKLRGAKFTTTRWSLAEFLQNKKVPTTVWFVAWILFFLVCLGFFKGEV